MASEGKKENSKENKDLIRLMIALAIFSFVLVGIMTIR